MKEIKFRAWDKEVMEMLTDVSLLDDTWDMMNEFFKYKKYDLVFMQYTGLKDRYGKEIYEGDILDSSYNLPVTGQLIKKRYVVAQDKGYYIAQSRKHPYGSTALSVIHADAKVVGNIYENPELMDDANN